MRATIVVSVEAPGEAEAIGAWFAKWGDALRYRSEDTGCGCCVHIWNVDGPGDAIAELPLEVRSESPWTRAHAS
jgi:hypothetical protein